MKLNEELDKLPEKSVVLVITSAKNFEETSLKLLSIMLEKYKEGGYITVNKPYQSMVKLLKSNNINERNVFFVDCVTEYLREKEKTSKNCYFVDSPADLTEIGIALDPIFKDKTHKFLVLDSVDLLTVYNDADSVVKFAHFLTGKLRMHNMGGVLLALKEKSDKKFLDELGQFCDKIITL